MYFVVGLKFCLFFPQGTWQKPSRPWECFLGFFGMVYLTNPQGQVKLHSDHQPAKTLKATQAKGKTAGLPSWIVLCRCALSKRE